MHAGIGYVTLNDEESKSVKTDATGSRDGDAELSGAARAVDSGLLVAQLITRMPPRRRMTCRIGRLWTLATVNTQSTRNASSAAATHRHRYRVRLRSSRSCGKSSLDRLKLSELFDAVSTQFPAVTGLLIPAEWGTHVERRAVDVDDPAVY